MIVQSRSVWRSCCSPALLSLMTEPIASLVSRRATVPRRSRSTKKDERTTTRLTGLMRGVDYRAGGVGDYRSFAAERAQDRVSTLERSRNVCGIGGTACDDAKARVANRQLLGRADKRGDVGAGRECLLDHEAAGAAVGAENH